MQFCKLRTAIVVDEVKAIGDKSIPTENFRGNIPFEFLGQTFKPHFNPLDGGVSKYKTQTQNLYITINGIQIEITNSLSHYYHAHNAYDLTISQVQEVVSKIAGIADMKPDKLFLKQLAIGFTIPISINPLDVISNYISHKGKAIVPMLKDGRKYGGKFFHTHYSLKAYDKGLEQSLRYRRKFTKDNLLRIELVLKSPVIPKEIGTLKDLTIADNWRLLFKVFLSQYDSIIKLPIIDYAKLTPLKLAKQIASEESRYWALLKEYNSDTYKTYMKRFKAEMLAGDNRIHDEVRNALEEQFSSLINNQLVPSFLPCTITEKRGQTDNNPLLISQEIN